MNHSKLYTVEITFSDFTNGIEQYEAETPYEAVELFFTKATCLEGYDRESLLVKVQKTLHNKKGLIHVAGNIRGVWLIVLGPDLLEDRKEDQEDIYGGMVVQTDSHAPRRS